VRLAPPLAFLSLIMSGFLSATVVTSTLEVDRMFSSRKNFLYGLHAIRKSIEQESAVNETAYRCFMEAEHQLEPHPILDL
jgi:hypothetical protein